MKKPYDFYIGQFVYTTHINRDGILNIYTASIVSRNVHQGKWNIRFTDEQMHHDWFLCLKSECNLFSTKEEAHDYLWKRAVAAGEEMKKIAGAHLRTPAPSFPVKTFTSKSAGSTQQAHYAEPAASQPNQGVTENKKDNMPTQFNPGQKIKCIDATGNRPWIKKGTIYTVAHHFGANELPDHQGRTGGGVMLLNHKHPRTGELKRPPVFYKASRFEAVSNNGETFNADVEENEENDL